jgi:tRNA(fMet)-specific endonuclease VapC
VKGYLLDTNVLSEITKKRPEPRVLERIRGVEPERLATSAVCAAELRYGAARHPAGERLWDRIDREVLTHVKILPFGGAEAVKAGELLAALEAKGVTIGIEDVLIGATAIVGALTVVTRNLRHFEAIPGLPVESWWP